MLIAGTPSHTPPQSISGDQIAPHRCVNPDGISEPQTYSHVVVAKGSCLVFISGQVAEDDGRLVGAGDMVAQSRQAFANLGRALAAVGAKPGDVTKLGIFVTNYRREHLAMIEKGRVALFGNYKPADTLVGVAALSYPDFIIEVGAIAVIDDA